MSPKDDRLRRTVGEQPIQGIIASLPPIDDAVQRDWNQLFREFVSHIQGCGSAGYPSFYDGWLHNEVIDSVRSGRNWIAIPNQPNDSDSVGI